MILPAAQQSLPQALEKAEAQAMAERVGWEAREAREPQEIIMGARAELRRLPPIVALEALALEALMELVGLAVRVVLAVKEVQAAAETAADS
jgi:hypothetical protein